MSLSDVASIGEFVSGVAVLISLIYLALQIRQTEKNQRAILSHGYVTRSSDNLRWFGGPSITALMARVYAGETDFTVEELTLLGLVFRVGLMNGQDAYRQYQSGLIDQMAYDNSALVLTRNWLALPVFRALWSSVRVSQAPEWRALIDKMMVGTPVAVAGDFAAEYRKSLAAVMAGANASTAPSRGSL